MSRQAAADVKQVVILQDGAREINRVRVDVEALVARAESLARGGDPIPEVVRLIAEALKTSEYAVSSRGLAKLERDCAQALARDRWPEELIVESEGTSRNGRPAGAGQNGTGRVRGGAPAPRRGVPGEPPPGELFERELTFPNEIASEAYEHLHGLDPVKERLVKEAVLLTRPDALEKWSRKHHGRRTIRAVESFSHGTPLLVFAGDVGTGKTALAQSFGDAVAREIREPVHLLQMSIKTRGTGIVGEMTQLITNAFRAVQERAARTGEVTVLLLDEADALGESRETAQMHHEDRAGVNALIQGVDLLRGSRLPILVIFCTNRLSSLDPAIRRRAADVFEFKRPNEEQRRAFLEAMLSDLDLAKRTMDQLVELTGPREGRPYGFTYSDLSDRLIRNAVIDAYPDGALDGPRLLRLADAMVPTRPFAGES
jgi:ATPase family associated with various cellular activities (AAA)